MGCIRSLGADHQTRELQPNGFWVTLLPLLRRGVRAVEGARLESVCTLIAYRGFESLPLRHYIKHLAYVE